MTAVERLQGAANNNRAAEMSRVVSSAWVIRTSPRESVIPDSYWGSSEMLKGRSKAPQVYTFSGIRTQELVRLQKFSC